MDLGRKLNLTSISQQLPPEKTIYKGDKNPWIEYHYEEYITFLIFSSGRIVCTGICSIDDAKKAIDMLSNMLE
jgi:TATA-box binding protein (TBP) (component of TFIID and TFIIIB)